ncbi:hypothetical protein ANN_18647 [Periplaneta americana]|uniref:Uncharacterized protein n=1 Tax=Periplaneta americana TaxID=6978 RepID=A0ABQ8SQL4_PERAM|nr:hypothetical protein ANN_18647 [Periplaneta americana]
MQKGRRTKIKMWWKKVFTPTRMEDVSDGSQDCMSSSDNNQAAAVDADGDTGDDLYKSNRSQDKVTHENVRKKDKRH